MIDKPVVYSISCENYDYRLAIPVVQIVLIPDYSFVLDPARYGLSLTM